MMGLYITLLFIYGVFVTFLLILKTRQNNSNERAINTYLENNKIVEPIIKRNFTKDKTEKLYLADGSEFHEENNTKNKARQDYQNAKVILTTERINKSFI